MPHRKASGRIMRCQPIITSSIIFKKLIWVDVKYPLTNFQGDKSGLGKPSKLFFETGHNMLPIPPKKHCPFILEGPLTTNPILSALHLQGLKSNIYICALQISK